MRIHHLVHSLARRAQLWWACRAPAPSGLPCRAVPNAPQKWLQLFNPIYVLRLAWLMRRERIDTLLVSSIISGPNALLLAALVPARLVYDAHNVEHLQMKRGGGRLWPLMYLLEWLLCRRADEVWCVSQTDAEEMVRRLGVARGRLRVVPNGAEVRPAAHRDSERRRLGLAEGQPFLLFFGVLSYSPNARAVHLLATEVLPRLRARGLRPLVAVAGVGGERLAARYPELRFVGFVPDLWPLLAAADAVVVPLESGGGTRMKILEALAGGAPVVTTAAGAEGLAKSACGSGLRIAADWDDFAAQVIGCLGVPRPLPVSADFVREYDWGHVLEQAVPM